MENKNEIDNDVIRLKNVVGDINRTINDSAFYNIFKERENFSELLSSVVDREIDPDTIKYYDAQSVVVSNRFKNDISFLTDDNKFIIMAEHQSTENENLALRFLIYYLEILLAYINDKNLKLHDDRAVKVPAPEIYVLYNGEQKLKNDVLDLSLNFENTDVLDFNIKVYNINYDMLSDKVLDSNNHVKGYAFIMKHLRDNKKAGMSPREAMQKAIDACREEGLLLDYLDRKEFKTIMLNELTYEEILDSRFEKGIEKGVTGEKLEVMKGLLEEDSPKSFIKKILKIDEATYNEYLEELVRRGEIEIKEQDSGMTMM